MLVQLFSFPHIRSMKPLPVFTILSAAISAGAPLFGQLLFEEVKNQGIEFRHHFLEDHPQAYLYQSGFAVGAIALGDVNADGRLDIYLAGGPRKNKLFIATGTKYEAIELPNSGADRWGTGASLVDIDNDGDLDLYQCNYAAPNQLFLNDGQGNYLELAGAAGLDVIDASLTPSFADVDNDGDLDLFLLCNRHYDPNGRPVRPPIKMIGGLIQIQEKFKKSLKLSPTPDGNFTIDEYGRPDYLFLNEGLDEKGLLHFRNVSDESGVHLDGYGLSSVWWDYDADGDLDLYVANDFTSEDRLFRNDGVDEKGIPRFANVIDSVFPHIAWSSMGSDVADVNNNGLQDLLSVDMSATTHFKSKINMGEMGGVRKKVLENGWPRQTMRNHLFINTGGAMFQEAAYAYKIASTDWSWTAKFGDLDNDGLQDVFVANGMARNFTDSDRNLAIGDKNKAQIGRTLWDLHKDGKPMLEENLVFQNLDGKQFEQRDDWGLGLLGMSYSAAMGDLDNDGDLDLVVSDLGKNVKVFKNRGSGLNYLRVKLTGTRSNRMGIGSKVVVTDSDGKSRSRWLNPWTGFQSQNDTTLHFGLGRSTARSISVVWPSGLYQELAIEAGQKEVSITEGGTRKAPTKTVPDARFTSAKAPAFVHKEKPFDDFRLQPLLPSKHSQLGPCLTKGDIDGDGDVDFYVGGATDQQGAVFLNDGAGSFVESPQPALAGPARYSEDNAAIWFDADGDKDLDLLIVTGSSEHVNADPRYHDRLFLNEGEGGEVKLKAAPEGSFPRLKDSGSCVVAADYDADGDLDLFIGSRLVPGKYPLSPHNRLLRNDSEDGNVKFNYATPPELKSCGMVTDATWTDLDADGDPDLALTIDWGAVMIFRNDNGVLVDITGTTGTADKRGWWSAIHALDVDGDGDIDLVAGNAGTNTKYKKLSDKQLAIIYYGDMDGSGIPRIVEAKSGVGKSRPLPVRGRS